MANERDVSALPRLEELARVQGGVVSRRQVYAYGVTRGQVRAHLRAGRWQRVGSQGIGLHTGTLLREGGWWAAVFEAGPRAFLDGASALVVAGLEHFDVERLRVSVPKGTRVRRARGLDIRETRRWRADDVATVGLPRARPAVAAVRAALWARSDRQAALLLTMAVQQGLCRPEELAVEAIRVRRDRRRRLVHDVVLEIAGGIRSLGELDVVRGCRERGLPEPEKQVVFRGRDGRYYLDFRWPRLGVVLEVDGLQHSWAENVVQDALRQNSLVLAGDVVLRLPLLGLRLCPDEFFAQLADALDRASQARLRPTA
jgi:hypothetical protein